MQPRVNGPSRFFDWEAFAALSLPGSVNHPNYYWDDPRVRDGIHSSFACLDRGLDVALLSLAALVCECSEHVLMGKLNRGESAFPHDSAGLSHVVGLHVRTSHDRLKASLTDCGISLLDSRR